MKKDNFLKWLSGTEDPYMGKIEMSVQEVKDEDDVRLDRQLRERDRREYLSAHVFNLRANTLLAGLQRAYHVLAVLFCILLVAVLIYAVIGLPILGNPNNPVNNEVAARYIESGLQETGAVNIVTGMILDYRAFDTLGESHVLFIGTCAVLILLRLDKGHKASRYGTFDENDRTFEPKNDLILQTIAKVLTPIIMIFGIYVILCGHLGPGGGFSGGAIIGAALILYVAAFGFEKTERFFNKKVYTALSVGALGCYSLCKCYSFYTGANHIESIIPLGTPGNILSSGLILILNICVGTVVAGTMYTLYAMFRKGGF